MTQLFSVSSMLIATYAPSLCLLLLAFCSRIGLYDTVGFKSAIVIHSLSFLTMVSFFTCCCQSGYSGKAILLVSPKTVFLTTCAFFYAAIRTLLPTFVVLFPLYVILSSPDSREGFGWVLYGLVLAVFPILIFFAAVAFGLFYSLRLWVRASWLAVLAANDHPDIFSTLPFFWKKTVLPMMVVMPISYFIFLAAWLRYGIQDSLHEFIISPIGLCTILLSLLLLIPVASDAGQVYARVLKENDG